MLQSKGFSILRAGAAQWSFEIGNRRRCPPQTHYEQTVLNRSITPTELFGA